MTLQYCSMPFVLKCEPVSGQGNRSCDSRFSKCHTHQCGSGFRPPATSVRPRAQSFPAPPCMETPSSWCGSAANADATARSPGPNRSLSVVADNRTADARRERNAVAQTEPTTSPRQQSATAQLRLRPARRGTGSAARKGGDGFSRPSAPRPLDHCATACNGGRETPPRPTINELGVPEVTFARPFQELDLGD
jgi:hypothetical protein